VRSGSKEFWERGRWGRNEDGIENGRSVMIIYRVDEGLIRWTN
jgi:hypothetical protein